MKEKFKYGDKEIKELRSEIEIRFKRQILTHRDCELLSNDIKETTGTAISVSTLRRLYGFDVSESFPSHYTLDTLSVYCGYHSWQQFTAMKKTTTGSRLISTRTAVESAPEVFDWSELKKEAHKVTDYSIKALDRKFGNYYRCVTPGQAFSERLTGFLGSDKTACAVIAPSGSGKTTMLARVVEQFWHNEDCLYPDDICWFIDASLLNVLINSNFDILHWLAAQFGVERRNIREYYKNNPGEKHGRIILIFDSIDDIISKGINLSEIFNLIINFVATNEESSWFKMVLSIRNDSWNKFLQFHKPFDNLLDQWYETPFVSYNDDFTNVPLLDNSEIDEFISLYCRKLPLNLLVELNNAVISRHFEKYLVKPEFLYIFLSIVVNEKKVPGNEVILISRYLEEYIFYDNLSEEKQLILENLAGLIFQQKKSRSIMKNRLLASFEGKDIHKAYDSLLSVGIIKERMNFNKYGSFTMYVSFSEDYIYEYLTILNKVKKGFHFDNDSLKRIFDNFPENSIRAQLILWFVKLAVFNAKYDFIDGLPSFFNSIRPGLSPEDYWSIFYPVIEYIGTIMRFNTRASGFLVPRFANDSNWRKMYFETFVDLDYLQVNYGLFLEIYLDYSEDVDSKLFAHTRLLLRSLMMKNFQDSQSIAKKIAGFNSNNSKSLFKNLLMQIFLSFDDAFSRKSVNPAVKKRLINCEKLIYNEDFNELQSILSAYFAVMNNIGEWERTIEICRNTGISHSRKSTAIPESYSFFSELLYADALIKAGKRTEARIVLNRLARPGFILNRNFFELCFFIVNARYFKAENKHDASEIELQKAKAIAWKYGFDYMIDIIEQECR